MEQKVNSSTGRPASLRPLASLRVDSTMGEAARQMYLAGTDAIVVVDDGRRNALGLVTAHDVVAVVAEGLDPEAITIGQRLQSPRIADPAAKPLTDLWFS